MFSFIRFGFKDWNYYYSSDFYFDVPSNPYGVIYVIPVF
jgi:hypothetical protein